MSYLMCGTDHVTGSHVNKEVHVRMDEAALERIRNRPDVRKPSVLILHEKHGDKHFLVRDDAEPHATAMSILRARNKCGYFYFRPEKPKDVGITQKQYDGLPDALKPEAKRKLTSYARELRWYENESEWYETMLRVVESGDGKRAWRLLKSRDGEYERADLVPFQDPVEYRA